MGKPILPQQSLKVRPRILVFCRNYLIPDFHDNFDPLLDDYEINYLTDQYCKLGTKDTRKSFYARLNQGQQCHELDSETELDVIERCRLLRNLDRDQASRMAHAMASVIIEVFEKIQPHLIFTHMVDEYILHLFYIFAKRRNIPYAAYCGSYFPGHALIFSTANGSAFAFREPDNEEVQDMLEKIFPLAFRQNYSQIKQYSMFQHVKLIFRYAAKKIIFPLKSFIENDHWGMHYKIVPFCADRRKLCDFPSKNDFVKDWQSELNKLTKNVSNKIIIYLPLSYYPEATTDYWVENKSLIGYENKIIQIIKTLALDCVVLVKEHVHMMGARNVSLHKVLNSLGSVISIHPDVIGNEVLLRSDAVILGSGSVGVEAYLRDKPVFSYCGTSYWFAHSKANYLDLNNISGWSNQIQETLPSFLPAEPDEKKKFISECLKCTVRTKFSGKRWPVLNNQDLGFLVEKLLQL